MWWRTCDCNNLDLMHHLFHKTIFLFEGKTFKELFVVPKIRPHNSNLPKIFKENCPSSWIYRNSQSQVVYPNVCRFQEKLYHSGLYFWLFCLDIQIINPNTRMSWVWRKERAFQRQVSNWIQCIHNYHTSSHSLQGTENTWFCLWKINSNCSPFRHLISLKKSQ